MNSPGPFYFLRPVDKVIEPSNTAGRRQKVGWFIVTLLLLLRIPYTIAIIYLLPIENQNGAAFYEVSTYLLTSFLIWWERQRLNEFHLGPAALLLIIGVRPVQTLILSYWGVDSPLAFPRPLGLALWLISLGLCIALIRDRSQRSRFTFRSAVWLFIGVLVGIGLSITAGGRSFFSTLNNASGSQVGLTPMLFSTSLNVFYHLGFAPVNEEPLFRGFLWGYLRQRKWNETVIWLFQAVLFTSAHLYLARQFPWMFWVFIPIAGLIFGLLTWRSRSIAPAMLAHALVNGSVYLVIAVLLLRFLR